MSYARVDILIDGYADEGLLKDRGIARYQPNIVLVRVDGAVMVVDPGTVERQHDLRAALDRFGVEVGHVTHVIHTHHHLDHTRNSGMFPDVPVIDAWATWHGCAYSKASPLCPSR
jgi:glyoxylase-like metal-dependent hydrolase (beta-lactamase superfamily II)